MPVKVPAFACDTGTSIPANSGSTGTLINGMPICNAFQQGRPPSIKLSSLMVSLLGLHGPVNGERAKEPDIIR